MAKKVIVGMIVATAIMAAAAGPALAQAGPDTRPVRFLVDIGYVNLFSQPKWVNLGPEVEIRLGKLFTFNPDVAVWLTQNFRGKVKIVPGATVNIRIKRFFVGAGAVRRIPDWPENPSDVGIDRGWLLPKVQAGYLTGPARLTLSVLFVGAADDVAVGLTLGMALGRPSGD